MFPEVLLSILETFASTFWGLIVAGSGRKRTTCSNLTIIKFTQGGECRLLLQGNAGGLGWLKPVVLWLTTGAAPPQTGLEVPAYKGLLEALERLSAERLSVSDG
jgi:hypothetical protein